MKLCFIKIFMTMMLVAGAVFLSPKDSRCLAPISGFSSAILAQAANLQNIIADVSGYQFTPGNDGKRPSLKINGKEAAWLGSGGNTDVFLHPSHPWAIRIDSISGNTGKVSQGVLLDEKKTNILADKNIGPRAIVKGLTDNGYGFLIVEEVEGESMEKILNRKGFLGLWGKGLNGTNRKYLLDLIAKMVNSGYYLTDFKPENIIIGKLNGVMGAWIIDPSGAMPVNKNLVPKYLAGGLHFWPEEVRNILSAHLQSLTDGFMPVDSAKATGRYV